MSNNTQHVETYETFMQRCELFFPHLECVRIGLVYRLAERDFLGITRKSEKDDSGNPVPYFKHLERVALILLDEAALVSSEAVLVALLHDAVEDTKMTLEEITVMCGIDVSRRVALCSKVPKQGFMERLMTHGDCITLCVKLADRIDNLRSLPENDPGFCRKQIAETESLYFTLATFAAERAGSDVLRASARRLNSVLIMALADARGKLVKAGHSV